MKGGWPSRLTNRRLNRFHWNPIQSNRAQSCLIVANRTPGIFAQENFSALALKSKAGADHAESSQIKVNQGESSREF